MSKLILGLVGGLFQGLATALVLKKQIPQIKNKKFLTMILILSLCGFVSLMFINNQLRFITTLIFFSLVIYFILGIKDITIIFYSFITEIILIVSEILGTLIMVLVGINSVDIVNNSIYNLLANFLISLIAILIIYIPLIQKIISKLISLFNKNRKLINYFSLVIMVLYFIVSKNGLELVLKSNYYVNIFSIVGIIAIVTILIKNELKSEQLKQEYQQMLNYLTKYEKIITEQGKANHEFKNQLMVIRGYAQMKSDKLIEYLDSITSDLNKTHSSYLISQLNKFPDGGIKGLLYYKLSVMDDLKINYQMDIENGIKSKLKDLDTETYKNITKILGVLLDNAIDASRKSKNKNIIISLIKDCKCVIFSISNTYSGNIEIDKFGTGYTTKGNGHGYGLKLVNYILDKNDDFSLDNALDEKYYTSKLTIKINKKVQNKK